MASTKVSALATATTLDGTELVPVVQGGVSEKATVAQIRRFIPYSATMLALTAATAPAAASAAANVEVFSASKATRTRVDLSRATEARLTAMVIANGSAATTALKLSYMTTEAATWAGTDAGPTVVLGTGTAGTLRDSGWVALPTGAKVDNLTVAVLVGSAVGLTAATIGSLAVYFR